MIDLLGSCSTVISFVDSALVIFESGDHLVRYSHRSSIVKSLSQFNFVSLGHIVGAETNIGNSDLRSEGALSILSSVDVGDVGLKTSSMSNVLKSMRGKTSVTSIVVEIACAINDLLFGEGEVSALAEDVPVGLHGSDGGEGPA